MPEYMTPKQVADHVGFSNQTVWRDINKGWLPAEKDTLDSRRYKVRRDIVQEYARRRAAYVKAFEHMSEPYETEGE